MKGLTVPTWQVMMREAHDYFMITLGLLCYAIGWILFLLPNDITTGGVAGVASLVYFASSHLIPVQYVYFGINAILLLLALKIMGFRFSLKTIFAVFMLTFLTSVIQKYVSPGFIISIDPFMAAIIGGFFCGTGIGLAFISNGSTGGTDIIAAIVNKYRDITLGRVILFFDIFIISSSFFVFQRWENVLYGIVTLAITSFVLDLVVNSARQSVQFFIVSKEYEHIGRRINKDLHRGVTVLDGTGLYTGQGVKVMFVLAKKRESTTIFRLVKDLDPNAFVSQSAVIGVYGEGFDHIKVK